MPPYFIQMLNYQAGIDKQTIYSARIDNCNASGDISFLLWRGGNYKTTCEVWAKALLKQDVRLDEVIGLAYSEFKQFS